MNLNLFNLEKFNIIQDEENYYFFRALNMADNNDIEQKITLDENGKIQRIRTDRERFEENPKYKENSQISFEEVYDHIKKNYRRDTNCISLTTNGNVAIYYGRGSYKDKYVMVRIPKKEFGKKVVSAFQYMLKELYLKIDQSLETLPEGKKEKILNAFKEIENASEDKNLEKLITKRYTAKIDELNREKAHLRKGIVYSSPKASISNYQALDEKQLIETNKIYAKLAILENQGILRYVIPHSSNSKLRETIGSAISSAEVIHYGEIKRENIIEISKEVVDIFALVQQIKDVDKSKIDELKKAILTEVNNGKIIPTIIEVSDQVGDNISIKEMYDITDGKIEYGKANSIVKNMFYFRKARQNAIALSNVLSDIINHNKKFDKIIDYIRKNGFRVEPEIISIQSGIGIKLSESVNLNISKDDEVLIDKIKNLDTEE